MRTATVIILLLVFFIPGYSKTIYVPKDFLTIQEAIDAAVDGDKVQVATGTYKENIDYKTKSITVESEQGPDFTVIDGMQAGRVVTIQGNSIDAFLDGFTITNGLADVGGGLFCGSGAQTVSRCIVTKNMTLEGDFNAYKNGGDGAGIHCFSATIVDCAITDNKAGDGASGFTSNDAGNGGWGGGIHCTDSSILDCAITSNAAGNGGTGWSAYYNAGDGGHGGGICCYASTVTNCTLFFNRSGRGGNSNDIGNGGAAGNGGGIFCADGHSLIAGCAMESNECGDGGVGYFNGEQGGSGGGIHADNSVIISNCHIRFNRAGNGGGCSIHPGSGSGHGGHGGGIFCKNATVKDCRITGNTGGVGGSADWPSSGGDGGYGGGINSTSSTILNCEITRNSAGDGADGIFMGGGPGDGGKGGGISCNSFDDMIVHCTLAANNAGYDGSDYSGGPPGPQQPGGGASSSSAIFKSCILWENVPDQIEIGLSDVTYSDIQDGWPGTGNINTDPVFVDPSNDDYHLAWTSPCINRGTNAGAPATDIDGEPRPTMGTVDMGADEFTDNHLLEADDFSLPNNTKTEQVNFTLNAGAAYGGRMYVILCSVSGTVPGVLLPGRTATLPINWDIVTSYMVNKLFLPNFTNFLGTLDPAGSATAAFIPSGILTGMAGMTMSFAYATNYPWFASNPINVEIVP